MGFVKERVMAVAPTTSDDMEERIRRAFYQQINKCLRVQGHHFKHLLRVDRNKGWWIL